MKSPLGLLGVGVGVGVGFGVGLGVGFGVGLGVGVGWGAGFGVGFGAVGWGAVVVRFVAAGVTGLGADGAAVTGFGADDGVVIFFVAAATALAVAAGFVPAAGLPADGAACRWVVVPVCGASAPLEPLVADES